MHNWYKKEYHVLMYYNIECNTEFETEELTGAAGSMHKNNEYGF